MKLEVSRDVYKKLKFIVKKRNGVIEDYDEHKIVTSIEKAFDYAESLLSHKKFKRERFIRDILEEIRKRLLESNEIDTTTIADIVEKKLIENIIEDGDIELVAKLYALARIYKQARLPIDIEEKDLKLSYNAIKLLEKRYLVRDPKTLNVLETPQMLFKRVAKHIAKAELNYSDDLSLIRVIEEKFYEILSNLYFLPNTPTLMNAGLDIGQLSACFVIPVHDDMNSIFEALRVMALVHKTGGGTGFDFSELRPEGDVVASTAGVASGPVSFMRIFDVATDVIKQGGKRRGANMGVLHVWHPDILKFVRSKSGDLKDVVLQNFNISVGVTDEFMIKALKRENFPLVNPRTGEIVREINAGELFDEICLRAWESGDPGLLFMDEINRRNPVKHLGEIRATNPCGEQPLYPYESCNLGSINLEKFVNNGKIDWVGLAEAVKLAVRFLDDVIDMNKYPIEEIKKATLKTRRVGLGVMGWAHMLIKLGIRYDSDDALYLAEKIMEWIEYNAIIASIELARERGAFPAFKGSDWEKGILPIDTARESVFDSKKLSNRVIDIVKDRPEVNWESLRNVVKKGIRNATITTIAPTGSIGIIAGTSTGIEPIFAIAFMRYVSVGTFMEVNKLFLDKLNNFLPIIDKRKLLESVLSNGSVQDAPLSKDLKQIFVTAHDIDPEWHVKMQAAFQRFTDNAVSKTINLRHNASIDDVKRSFLLAWKLGCKGITVYRDQSKSIQVISFGVKNGGKGKTKEEKSSKIPNLNFKFWKDEKNRLTLDEEFAGCTKCEI